MGNTAASVRGRLTNRAKASQRPFQEVLQHYGLERLLYRLAQSPHRSRFLLKGALLLNAWNAPVSRPTRDIDLLGYAENDVAVMEAMFRHVCDVAAPAWRERGGRHPGQTSPAVPGRCRPDRSRARRSRRRGLLADFQKPAHTSVDGLQQLRGNRSGELEQIRLVDRSDLRRVGDRVSGQAGCFLW